ncbi:MAG: T9SS type A sorting domain-containing protein [Bacteroidota bacterium]
MNRNLVTRKALSLVFGRTMLFAALLSLCILANNIELLAQDLGGENGSTTTLSADNPAVQHVMQVQNSVTDAMMSIEGITGTGTGMTPEGLPAIVLFTSPDMKGNLPTEIQGIPVIRYVMETGTPIADSEAAAPLGKSFGKATVSRTTRLDRPVPIGVSTGNWNDCSGGTIGVRVKNGNNYYVLSCNHVFARTNYAALNEKIVQPGRGDVGCIGALAADTIGSLADYQVITHTTSASNLMDAAMVRVLPWFVNNATPSDGYGIPSATVVNASVGMSVKKYGKTTGQTVGNVMAINASVYINYGAGTTKFINQIVVSSSTTFIDVGDSGSLVVTNTNQNRSIGMVFGRSGSYTFVSPIGPILTRFNVQIDDALNNPLPVELTSFSGRMQDSDVQLKWRTATELQNFGFYVQRSADKEAWEDITFVAGAGTSFSPRSYEYTDSKVTDLFGSETIYYRLLQVDRDGTEDYTSIVEVASRPMAVDMQVYPQPVRSEATVQISTEELGDGELAVYDATGQRLDQFTRNVYTSGGMQLLPLSFSNAAPGHYFIEFRNNGDIIRKRILVVR